MVRGLLRRTSNESLSHSSPPKKTWGLASACGCVKRSPNGTEGAYKSNRRMQMGRTAPSLPFFCPTREAHASTSGSRPIAYISWHQHFGAVRTELSSRQNNEQAPILSSLLSSPLSSREVV